MGRVITTVRTINLQLEANTLQLATEVSVWTVRTCGYRTRQFVIAPPCGCASQCLRLVVRTVEICLIKKKELLKMKIIGRVFAAVILPCVLSAWFTTVLMLSRSTNKMQLCNRIYYSKVYWRRNMFRAAHRSSSGVLNCICSLWFIYPCGGRPLQRLSGKSSISH